MTEQYIDLQTINNDYVEKIYYDTLTTVEKTPTINLDIDVND